MNKSWNSFLRQKGAIFDDLSIQRFGTGASVYLDPKDTILSPINSMGVARVSGSDAAEFLQAQLTGDVRGIELETNTISGYCNPKGRLLAIFRVLRDGDDFLLLSDLEILPGILERLQKYVLRANVKLAMDATLVAIGLLGPRSKQIVAELTGDNVELGNRVFHKRDIYSMPLGKQENAYLLLATPKQFISSWGLIQKETQLAGTDQWSLFEIRSGLARITPATQESFIPQNVNLDLVGGVSFSKGCYPGQEIVARVRYLGRIKHRMARAVTDNQYLLTAGDPIFSSTETTQRVGNVINAVDLPNGTEELLVTVPPGSPIGTKFSVDRTSNHLRLVEVPDAELT
jgi:hypothetical protein